jgi:hypothetical protein
MLSVDLIRVRASLLTNPGGFGVLWEQNDPSSRAYFQLSCAIAVQKRFGLGTQCHRGTDCGVIHDPVERLQCSSRGLSRGTYWICFQRPHARTCPLAEARLEPKAFIAELKTSTTLQKSLQKGSQEFSPKPSHALIFCALTSIIVSHVFVLLKNWATKSTFHFHNAFLIVDLAIHRIPSGGVCLS